MINVRKKKNYPIQDLLPTLLFLKIPLCCFPAPFCCFCGPFCRHSHFVDSFVPFCWFCCFWSTKWDWAFPKCHSPSRMLILYLSRINYSCPWKAKNQQFLLNKTDSTNLIFVCVAWKISCVYLSRINYSGPWKAKNQPFLSNKIESSNCVFVCVARKIS